MKLSCVQFDARRTKNNNKKKETSIKRIRYGRGTKTEREAIFSESSQIFLVLINKCRDYLGENFILI